MSQCVGTSHIGPIHTEPVFLHDAPKSKASSSSSSSTFFSFFSFFPFLAGGAAVGAGAGDGLLRPGEIMPKKGFISQSNVTFERDGSGKLISATVMIVPIKRYGKDVGSTAKRPSVIKANRGGRSADGRTP